MLLDPYHQHPRFDRSECWGRRKEDHHRRRVSDSHAPAGLGWMIDRKLLTRQDSRGLNFVLSLASDIASTKYHATTKGPGLRISQLVTG
jgi:hypothetical protein